MDLKDLAALQTKEPYKTYRKTILAQVLVVGYNTFTSSPEEKILKGNPLEEDAMIDVWSEMEDVFFRRNNMRHLKQGTIIEHSRSGEKEELGVEQSSDEDIRKAVNSKYAVLNALLKDTTSETFLNRVLAIAREEEKSEKIIGYIETRISEVQMKKVENL